MSDAPYCALQVIRVKDTQRNTNNAKLYVKIKHGESICKISEINDDGTPSYYDSFTFPRLDPSTVFNIALKTKSRRHFRNELGRADVTVAHLLEAHAEHEVRLTQMRSGRPEHAATIVLAYRDIDALSRATIDVEAAEQSVERIRTSGEKSESAVAVIESVKEVLDTVVEIVDKVAEVHPLFQVSWKATSALYKLVSHQYDNDTKLISMVDQMRNAHDFTNVAKDLKDTGNMIKPKLKELLDETAKCSEFVREYVQHNFAVRMARIRDREKMDGFSTRFIDLRRELDSVIGATAAKVVTDIRLQQQLEYHLNPFTLDASDVSKRPRCLDGTREEYLGSITEFLSSDGAPNVLLLTGATGSGKSTIAVTVSDRCDKMGCSAAYLFFEREKSEPGSVIRTIAYRLAMIHPFFASQLSDACEKNKNINGNTLKTQFEVLLLGPLNAIEEGRSTRIVIILDALDECGAVEHREELITLLKNDFARLPSKVRVLITSRPENDIMKDLSSKSHIRRVTLEHKSDQNQQDVNRYIRETMSALVGESATREEGWDYKMQVLCEAGDGLFIWASTAVKIVKRSEVRWEQLDALLEDIRSIGEYGIDGLYATALKDSGIVWRSPKSRDRFSGVVGLVVLAKEELSAPVIAALLGLREDLVDITLGHLQPVVSFGPGRPVHLHHASFADYLLSAERSGAQPWHIDASGRKLAIAERFLDIMAEMLRFNICDIESSFVYNKDITDLQERIGKNVPTHLNYACRFWATHVCELSHSISLTSLVAKLRTFAHTRLLYWFEVLSLTGNFNRVAIRALYEVTQWAAPIDPDLSSFLWAAYRLASVFSMPISQSAPQIYLSAISLSRGESRVADHYSSTHPCVPIKRYGSKPPVQCMNVIKGRRDVITSAAVSSDGKRIVSGSYGHTVCIWDTDTGELVLGPLEGHTDWVRAVAFSQDGKRVVSGSLDKTIRIWNAVTGELVSGPLEGHTGEANSVAFSLDGKRIVSGSSDSTVRIWDVNTSSLIAGPFKGHARKVNSVGFSPDGTRVVSGSDDKTIRVWDAKSGVVITFRGHTHWVNSVAFSPDGSRIVSGSYDKTIRVWNTDTGQLVSGPFEGHTDIVNSVAFSPDGNLIVSGSNDVTVRIWDSNTGELISGPFEGHVSFVKSVAFSPDGIRAVSGSGDGTIRIWDIDSGMVLLTPFHRYESRVCSVGFSADGKWAVSGFRDGKTRVWDNNSGEPFSGTFEGHTDRVSSVALSEDGTLVASGSRDNVRVWNASSGELVSGPLKGHTGWVVSVAFSRDGRLVVSGSWDNTIRIWNAASGERVSGPLEGHAGWFWSVAFSPDGSLVASGSDDRAFRVWNAVTGALVSRLFQERESCVMSVAFSPDGEKIVCGSLSGTICIWGAATGKVVLGPLEGHAGPVNSVMFSSDGKRLVSGSGDKTIRVWDAASGELILTLHGHGDSVLAVAFSPDGRYIYSGSEDGTIRTWYVGGGIGMLGMHKRISEHSERNVSSVGPEISLNANQVAEVSGSDLRRKRAITDWKVTEDGWVVTEKGEVLTWVPEDMRTTLWQARNVILFGCQFSTRLNFSNAPVGQGWYRDFPQRDGIIG